ncbi:MAG: TIGR03013 family PEP-CTERM/XrtA system glycosyltransferase [Candidatus Tectomicrobia bacterium]|uniref:TIGR03013 family PEP-CTERM/XrtA system glycosyltransferase n=1 Tax=Tectimicrobiota bacterium TaxID=2528274 RepID=A0A932FWT8_UNCTE|nr:TIGR03013 family PEP-CTERM/XrtA system glycosyltransferase [Candidatus Tectomicrobia bacterium]
MRISFTKALFFLSEAFWIFSAVIAGAFIRFGFSPEATVEYAEVIPKALLVVAVFQLCLYYFDLYDFNLVADRQELSIRLLQGIGAATLVLAVVYYLLPGAIIGRGIFVISLGLLILTLFTWRLLCNWLLQARGFREPILVLGAGEMAKGIVREVIVRKDSGYQVIGFIDDDPASLGVSLVNPRVIANSGQMFRVAQEHGVRRIVVAQTDRRGKLPIEALLDCRLHGIRVEEGASFYERLTGKIPVEELRPSWLIFSEGFVRSRLALFLKAIIDFTASLALLILLAPLLLAVALLIKLDSRGPVFFQQARVGQGGKVFTLYKFRSMQEDAEAQGRPVWAQKDDPRVTRVGRLIRKTRIDEIPQVFSVLTGEMSFVGPRPERPFFVEQLRQQIPYYNQRHVMKPGITGWAQINYHYGSSVDDAIEKLRYDLYYIKHVTPLLDLFIIFQTVKVVLFGEGAW